MWVRMLVRSLTRRRSRVIIAMLAVAIGATTLTALATVAIDIPRQMGHELRSAGANLVVLADDAGPGLRVSSLADIDAALAGEPVVASAAYRYLTVRLHSQPYLAAGTDVAGAWEVNPYWAIDGDLPGPGEMLIGRDIAEWTGVEAGEMVSVSAGGGDGIGGGDGQEGETSATMRVSGIVRTGGSEDALVIMGLPDIEVLAGQEDVLDMVEYSVNVPGERVEELAGRIDAAVPAANAGPVTRLTRTDADVLDMLQSLLALIAAVVLGLTMIGVTTTMMAVVTERRTEIALRKAIGADSRSITREFLGEAMVLGGLGGAVGSGAGYAVAQAISVNVFQRPVGFVPWLAAVAIVVSVLVTRLASVVPVRRASQIDPAIVLKGE
jgi:putative ABC transport system permease protein